MTLRGIEDFALERFFARFEFSAAHQLSASDIEPLTLAGLLALADADGLERWERLTLGYTESAGLPALREAIAGMYATLAPDDILVTAGAEESIFLLMHALVIPGDEVVVVTPAYQSLHAVAESIGARAVRVPLRWERRWELDTEDVARAVTDRTRAIVVNFPHNPTGAHISSAQQRRLVEIADAAGATLVADEVYRGLEHRDGALLPHAADIGDRAASIGVMSKTFALAGLRMGWIATRDATLLRGVARLKDYTTICNSAPSEILSLIALRARDAIVRRSRDIVVGNLRHARDFMNRHREDLEWIEPSAGSTGFPRFHSRQADDVSRALRDDAGVLLLPGSLFDAAPAFFRLGLGRRDLPVALSKLAALLAS